MKRPLQPRSRRAGPDAILQLRAHQLRWLAVIGSLLVLALVGLGARLVHLQVVRHAELREKAVSLTQESIVREPWRGNILDVNGNPLATSMPIKRVCADPSLLMGRHQEVARILAPLLETDEAELSKRLEPKFKVLTNGVFKTNQFVELRYEATLERWQQITQAMFAFRPEADDVRLTKIQKRAWQVLRSRAVFGVDGQRRIYPNRELAAHVVGVVGITNYYVQNRPVRELLGLEGIEATFNKPLSGVHGVLTTEKDRKNRELVRYRGQDVEALSGLDVVLTLDLVLQKILEAELAAIRVKCQPSNALGIIVRPKTGEILAMAGLRSFDPNDLKLSPPENRRNRWITDFYEPGSTFKVVSLSAGLNEGVTRLTDLYDCEKGRWIYGGKELTDHLHYGVMPLQTVFAKSSNIGMAKMALRMQDSVLHRYVRQFGFGTKSGIELPGEVNGIVRDVSRWNKLSMTRVPIGYEIGASPLQMTMAVAAVANQGVLMRPQLVKRLKDAEGNVLREFVPTRVREVITPATAQQVLQAMKAVVSTNGTGTKAILADYTVAGKTGTARKYNTVTHQYDRRYYSSFIGLFPADNPELCIAVIVDDPQAGGDIYGGQLAAPAFQRIAEQAAHYLKIPPDRGDLVGVNAGFPGPQLVLERNRQD